MLGSLERANLNRWTEFIYITLRNAKKKLGARELERKIDEIRQRTYFSMVFNIITVRGLVVFP